MFQPARLALSTLATIAIAGAALAQSWPTRPVTMVVPFAAGSSTDTAGRLLAVGISEALGQQVIVENIGGAGGMTGTARVAKAAPDGYTLLTSTMTNVLNMSLYEKLDFNFLRHGQLFECLIFAHVAGDHFLHLPGFQKQADPEIVDSGVVGDQREVFRAFADEGGNEIFGDAAEAEASEQNGGAVFNACDGGIRVRDAFVHFFSAPRISLREDLTEKFTAFRRQFCRFGEARN